MTRDPQKGSATLLLARYGVDLTRMHLGNHSQHEANHRHRHVRLVEQRKRDAMKTCPVVSVEISALSVLMSSANLPSTPGLTQCSPDLYLPDHLQE